MFFCRSESDISKGSDQGKAGGPEIAYNVLIEEATFLTCSRYLFNRKRNADWRCQVCVNIQMVWKWHIQRWHIEIQKCRLDIEFWTATSFNMRKRRLLSWAKTWQGIDGRWRRHENNTKNWHRTSLSIIANLYMPRGESYAPTWKHFCIAKQLLFLICKQNVKSKTIAYLISGKRCHLKVYRLYSKLLKLSRSGIGPFRYINPPIDGLVTQKPIFKDVISSINHFAPRCSYQLRWKLSNALSHLFALRIRSKEQTNNFLLGPTKLLLAYCK